MRLSRLDKKILKFIWNSYPIIYDPSESNRLFAIGERPLLTEKNVQQKFVSKSEEAVNKTIRHLIEFQYIKEVYLAAPGDFVDQLRAPGQVMRHRKLGPGAGHNGYQVTEHGNKVIDGFISTRFKRWVPKLVITLLEKYMPFILVFLLCILFSHLSIGF